MPYRSHTFIHSGTSGSPWTLALCCHINRSLERTDKDWGWIYRGQGPSEKGAMPNCWRRMFCKLKTKQKTHVCNSIKFVTLIWQLHYWPQLSCWQGSTSPAGREMEDRMLPGCGWNDRALTKTLHPRSLRGNKVNNTTTITNSDKYERNRPASKVK